MATDWDCLVADAQGAHGRKWRGLLYSMKGLWRTPDGKGLRKYSLQGDREMYTAEAVAARSALRRDARVVRELKLYWKAVHALGRRSTSPRRQVSPAAGTPATVSREKYFNLCMRIYRVLHEMDGGATWNDAAEAEAWAHVTNDWDHDCAGKTFLTRAQFELSFFELADTWTRTTEANERLGIAPEASELPRGVTADSALARGTCLIWKLRPEPP